MSISSKKSDDGKQIEVSISGRFDFSVHKEFRYVYENNHPAISYTVNLRHADYIDSSALGMLLLLWEHVQSDKSKLQIVNCPQQILSVFKIANLDKMIRIS